MGSPVTPGRAARFLAWTAFGLVMLLMTCLTLLVLCFFIPFVILKAFWVLLVQPVLSPEKGQPQKAGPA